MRGSNTCELVFEDCELTEAHVLGRVDEGTRVLMRGLDSERLVLSGGPLGIMQAALDLVLPYVRERRQFGQPIGGFELMQGKLADMYTALEAARALTYRVAACFDRGEQSRKDAAACLLFASESAVRVALEAIQCLGARGYMNDSPAGRLLRDAKVYDIGGGTKEIRRWLIGRELVERGL
jgi:isovaleryl-CoA dehydrogenase